MMRRLFALALCSLTGLGACYRTADAATTSVTKAYRVYWSNTYTLTVADSAVKVSAYPHKDNPIVSGGCKLTSHLGPRGRRYVDGVTCPTPGTVKYVSPDFPACDTPFTITVDAAVVYTDLLNTPCPPPPPPAVAVTATDGELTFTNPATIVQTRVAELGVDSADELLWSADPFTYTIQTRYSSSGPNTYVYYRAIVTVTLNPGQTIVVTDATPGDNPTITPMPSGTIYCALHATKGGQACLIWAVAP